MRDARAFKRYAARLRGYLRRPLPFDAAPGIVASALARRESGFLRLLEDGVYARPASPYRWLLEEAGIEYGDAVALVRERGVEGALRVLHDEGVRVSLEELKGRRPILRGGRSREVVAGDFDNPIGSSDFVGRGGGSRSAPRRVAVDLDVLEHEAAHLALFLRAAGLEGHAVGQWRAAPPGLAGIKDALRFAKLGAPVEAWFSPTRERAPRDVAFTAYTLVAARASGRRIARPVHVPLDRPEPVLRWLERCAARGAPAFLSTTASAGVRLCLAATARRVEIEGTVLRLGGEPYTAAREEIVRAAGARAVCHYSMHEVGKVGMACTTPSARDDVHLLEDKVAAVHRDGVLSLTTVHPAAPKLLLNVETDDRVVVEERDCGCPLGRLGLRRHLHTIRSVEKLTSEGLAIGPIDVLRLVEDVLPGRFGGSAPDFQLEEDRSGALPRVSVVISPRVGAVDEAAVTEAVLAALGAGEAHRRMAARMWRDASTLRVVRREPSATAVGKVLPVHVSPPPAPPSRAR